MGRAGGGCARECSVELLVAGFYFRKPPPKTVFKDKSLITRSVGKAVMAGVGSTGHIKKAGLEATTAPTPAKEDDKDDVKTERVTSARRPCAAPLSLWPFLASAVTLVWHFSRFVTNRPSLAQR